jgi:hypothetical protein
MEGVWKYENRNLQPAIANQNLQPTIFIKYKMKMGLLLFYRFSVQWPHLVILGAPGDKAYVIFTVALVKRIPLFLLLPFLCRTNFTWFIYFKKKTTKKKKKKNFIWFSLELKD